MVSQQRDGRAQCRTPGHPVIHAHMVTREREEDIRCFRLVSGATRRAVWLADGGVAKSDIARSSIHRWESETSEVALKVGVQH
jgi:hypothetical protein